MKIILGKSFLLVALLFSTVLLSGCSLMGDPTVKKSSTGICHEEGTLFHKNTKNFTSYNSLDDCLASGGRLPKK